MARLDSIDSIKDAPTPDGSRAAAVEILEGADPIERILSIDNVAETFAVSKWLLLFCELRGFVRRRRRIGRAWVYGWADCDRIAFIIKCRRAGVGLSEIEPVIRAADLDPADGLAHVQDAGRAQCAALIGRLTRRRKAVDEALAELGHVRAVLAGKDA